MGAGGIRPGFEKVIDTDYSGAQMMPRALSGPISTGIISNNLAIGADQLRDRYFFLCQTKQTDIL